MQAASLLFENETVDFELPNVLLKSTKREYDGLGTLIISNMRVFWIGSNSEFIVKVTDVVLHAIAREYEKPCIYCQLDSEENDNFVSAVGTISSEANKEEISSDDEEGIDQQNIDVEFEELYFIPENEDLLQVMFDAFSHAALLNPDEEMEEELESELIFNVDEVELNSEQASMLDHLESVFQVPENFTSDK